MSSPSETVQVSGPNLIDDFEAGELAIHFDDKEPEDLLEWAFERFGDRLAIITSFQIDTLVLLDMAYQINPKVRVITVDTGRLPQETHDLIDQVRDKYKINVEVRYPDAAHVEAMVQRNGMNLFRKSVPSRLLCCHLRKVLPLQRALEDLDAWITGLRRDQWATRANIRKVDLDHDHGGIVKLNPLADWSHDDVWAYAKEYDVPNHPLYSQGFSSIGCVPCTRAIKPGEDSRAGRWWWETNAPKECGMHCPIETGGFEHEVHAILGEEARTENLGHR
ncbi:MAG: phosphoadenylyl-sulfate reductase [Isosphaeraceae bacterium]